MSASVYFVPLGDDATPEQRAEATRRIAEAAGVGKQISKDEYVAIKIHVGDENNTTAIPPASSAALVSLARDHGGIPFLTETSTLYRGARQNAVVHIQHAVSRGFSVERVGAPFIMADGLAGDSEMAVPIEGKLFDEVHVAREARMADVLIVLSHMTGHMVAGFGACIKNLGMGLASRKGKLRQHSSMSPEVVPGSCVNCGKCMQWCPADAIIERDGVAFIQPDPCIGCGECLAVCRVGAIKYDWGADSVWMQQAMAEHALGVVKDKKAFYLNDCCTMTKECDCMPVKQDVLIGNVGIFGSFDPVALDAASLDRTVEGSGPDLSTLSYPHLDGRAQLRHAEAIGLGTTKYDIITLEP